MIDPATTAMATRHLGREEGRVPYAYKDSLGYLTIGIGRLIDKAKGGRLRDDEIDFLLSNDIADCVLQMQSWPSWQAVQDNPARATALISMCFQLGASGLASFKNTLALVASRQFDKAADAMLQSKWATQTPARAKRVASMMRTGVEA